jgi:hypothetical protein
MQQLTSIIQDGATSSRQSSSLAVELDEIANQLKQISSQFKVDSNQTNGSSGGATGSERLEDLITSPIPSYSDAGDASNWQPEPI